MENYVNSSRWTIDETKMLLSLWCEEHVQDQLEGTVRDSEVYKMLEKALKLKGIHRNSTQIKTRLKVLKRLYKEQKDKFQTTGESGKIKFQFYAQMDSVLGTRQSTKPTGILETAIPGFDNIDSSHIVNRADSILSTSIMDEDISCSDLDTSLQSMTGDPATIALADDQENSEAQGEGQGEAQGEGQGDAQGEGQGEAQGEGNADDSVAGSTPGPSTASNNRRKKKTLKEILPQTMERCVERFINYQKQMDKEYLDMEKEQLKVEKENLELKREALDFFKRVFQ